jgi:hypothetical protein
LRRTIIEDPKEDAGVVERYGVERITFQPSLLVKAHASRHKLKGIGVSNT